jgi:hypothetical protein
MVGKDKKKSKAKRKRSKKEKLASLNKARFST